MESRYRARSLWLDGLAGTLAPRPPLAGDDEADVVVVGCGFTGAWTAYHLALHAPELRIVVLEAEIAGYGASGRNAGFVSAGIAGEARVYERRGGLDGLVRAERAFIDAIDDVGRIVAAEGIDCGYEKGGSLRVATSAAQLARVDAALGGRRRRGIEEADMVRVGPDEIARRVRVAGALGGTFTPHCARVDPARLCRGLAAACERRGATIHESTPVRRIEPGRAVCDAGVVRARTVVRATESYTTRLPGQRRSYLPVYSHAIATAPLPPAVWAAIGWDGCETIADQHHLFRYAQRTPDGRILVGGAGGPYRYASAIREADEQRPAVHGRLEETLRAWFPQAAAVPITHRWGGPFSVPRDWSMGIVHDAATGLAHAGGYSGHGVIGSHIAGRTLADLILGRDTALVTLPWVGHRSPRWEPEPVRWLAATAIAGVLGSADRAEDRGAPRARRARLVARFTPGR